MTQAMPQVLSLFPVHTTDSAPEGSRETLREVQRALGMIPHLAATMATSPALLSGFFALRDTLHRRGTFSPAEIQVLSLVNAYENRCRYCMALHSAMAEKDGVSPGSVAELRAGGSAVEPRLAALSRFARQLTRQRGRVSEEDLDTFVAAGYERGQALEVVLAAAVSLLANYSHHLTEAPLDEVFIRHAWAPSSEE